jgi:hypothetical protein
MIYLTYLNYDNSPLLNAEAGVYHMELRKINQNWIARNHVNLLFSEYFPFAKQ